MTVIATITEDTIHKAVAPIVLEMSSEDYESMPPISYNNIKVTLPTEAMSYYKKMEKELNVK